MHITMIIASRGRPHQAVGVIESAKILSSGKIPLDFVVACDDDDPADTAGFFSRYGDKDITIDCGPRPTGVAACWNRCIGVAKGDTILTMPDDCVICTPYWDLIADISLNPRHHPVPELPIVALQDKANPGQGTLFMLRKEWVTLAGGLFDERFPFWYSDTAITELYSFTCGKPMPIACAPLYVGQGTIVLEAANKPGQFNPRMRDMPLWWRLYAATRKERLETAARMRRNLAIHVPQEELDALVAACIRRDEGGLPASEAIVREIDAMYPDRVPDERYLMAKAAAMEYLGLSGAGGTP